MPTIPTRKTAMLAALAAASVSLAPALPARAQTVLAEVPGLDRSMPLAGLRASVARGLPTHGFDDVDVRRLSSAQVAQINYLLHSDRSEGDKRGLIRATLRSPGPLQALITGSVGVGVVVRN